MEQAVEVHPDYILEHLGKDIEDEEWRSLMLDYYKALGKGRFGYSQQSIKMAVNSSTIGIFALHARLTKNRYKQCGSMAVEARIDPQTAKRFPSVVWLTIYDGFSLEEDLIDVIYDHLCNIARGLGSDEIVIGGRPGWFDKLAHLDPKLMRQEFSLPVREE